VEKESAPKEQFRLKKKTILWFFLVLTSVAILFSTYFFLFYEKEDPLEKDGPVGEEESSVGTSEIVFADDDKSDYDPLKVNKVKIRSTGQTYEEEVIIGEKPVRLFILKSLYDDVQGVERELDVVVGILFDGNYENILNWWTYNLVIDEIDIDSLGNEFFEESYLESIFKSGTSWEYLYYSSSSIPVSDEYLKVVKEVMNEESLEKLEERLTLGESEGLILMPYLIYEISD
jgi:hypothetical protein